MTSQTPAKRFFQIIENHPWAALVVVIVFCLIARHLYYVLLNPGLYVHSFYQNVSEQFFANKSLYYVTSTYTLYPLNGEPIVIGTPIDRPPMYPLLLAVSRYFAPSYVTATYNLQFVLWVLMLLATYGFTQAAFGRRLISLMAVLMVGLYPYLASNSLVQSDQITTGVLFLAMALAAVKLKQTGKLAYAVAFGVLMVLELLTRGLSVVFAPLVIALLLVTLKPVKKAFASVALIGVSAGVLLFPWMAYTNSIYGQPVIVSGLGLRVWEGNNPYLEICSYPVYHIDYCDISDAGESLPGELVEQLAQASPRERDQLLLQTGLNEIVSNPVQTLRRMVRKLNAVWSPLYNPTYDLGGGSASTLKRMTYTVSYSLLVGLALVGMGFAWRRRIRFPLVLSLCVFAAYSLYSAVLWGHSIHKLFLMPFFGILAAYGLVWGAEQLFNRFKR